MVLSISKYMHALFRTSRSEKAGNKSWVRSIPITAEMDSTGCGLSKPFRKPKPAVRDKKVAARKAAKKARKASRK